MLSVTKPLRGTSDLSGQGDGGGASRQAPSPCFSAGPERVASRSSGSCVRFRGARGRELRRPGRTRPSSQGDYLVRRESFLPLGTADTITFFPCRYRDTYLPRTPSLKSYSDRMSSDRLALFFIGFALMPGRRACVDDAYSIASIRVSHNQQSAAVRCPNEYISLFAGGMLGIGDRNRQWVVERRYCLAKADTMLLIVGRRFARVPFEPKPQSSPRTKPSSRVTIAGGTGTLSPK